MAAHEMVRAGMRVLMIERGATVAPRDGERHGVWDFFQLGPAYETSTPYAVTHRGRTGSEGMIASVGGASVFYGGASFRFRESDFAPPPEITGDSGAEWPLGYAALEPFYTRAEQLLQVAGEAGADPTEPPRSAPYPRTPAPLAPISARIAEAARGLGLHPFRIPISLSPDLVTCTSNDGYAWEGVSGVLGRLQGSQFELREQTVAVRLREQGGQIIGLECIDRRSGTRKTITAQVYVLAAGALATPHLLLASELDRVNPGGHSVGRYLTRHCNAFVYGVFPQFPEPERHHKQIAIHDFYVAPDGRKLGNIQQIMHPQLGGLLRRPATVLPKPATNALARLLRPLTDHMTGLQVIAEDEPREANRVELDRSTTDDWGLPRLRVVHDYTERDLAARAELVRHARKILRRAGALPALHTYNVTTFSHAAGTVRMGRDPATSALDEHCRFRGVDNLYVADSSFMPTSAAVNPSLTIAANALRVGTHAAEAGTP